MKLDLETIAAPRHIPRPVQFILHFFSGRRRVHDLQYHLESLALAQGVEVHVRSLDVAVDQRLGNLASTEAFEFWTDKSLRGFILSFMAGPPCETFSRSRFRPGGPPPLRSKQHRWGLPGLLGKFHRQVESGNFLWRFSTSMMVCQAVVGKGGIFEHPAPFDIDQGPCEGGIHTWAFPEVVTFGWWPTLFLLLVDQGKFGQVSRKPTGFWVLNLGQAQSIFHAHELPRHLWHMDGVEMGWDREHKRFATSPLKEYPPQLNKALAAILLSQLDSEPVAPPSQLDGDFTVFMAETEHLRVALDQCPEGEMQPDWFQS